MLEQGFRYFIRRLDKPLFTIMSLLGLVVFSWALYATDVQNPTPALPKDMSGLDRASLVIAPNLSAQLAKFRPVRMPFDSAHLTPRERQLAAKLVEACQFLESIYWRQSDPEGLRLYHALDGSTAPRGMLSCAAF